MAWYRTPKLALDMFRNYANKVFRASGQYKTGFFGSSTSPNNCLAAVVDGVGRHYHVDRHQVYHFKQRNFITRNVKIGLGLAGIVCFTNLEKIPYSKRTRLVLLPRAVEKALGELIFKVYKMRHMAEILPATHPTSVRAVLVANNVITALEKGLRDEKVWGDSSYASRATQYLNHVNWELVVVDKPTINAICYPGGKIVLYTGFLRQLNSDAEIAFTVGHEVAHAVARHSGEQITKSILRELLGDFMPEVFRTMISRKCESEADYIGVMLMASAGYDPRVAVAVWEKMAKLRGPDLDYSYLTKLTRKVLSTHPSDKERAEFLAQAQEEAMKFYKESHEKTCSTY